MHELALFTGIGGGLLGSKLLGWTTICAVEKEPYCREVLLRRQRDGMLDMFPIWDDIRTFDGSNWKADIITAGFPCQPFSAAGLEKAGDDERNLWPDTIRVIQECKPKYALLENVPRLLSSGYFGTILEDLSKSGYDVRWECISAKSIGAPHERERLWIMAYSQEFAKWTGLCSNKSPEIWGRRFSDKSSPWYKDPAIHSKSGVGRMADGIPYRVDRLKSLGNAQVPGVVKAAGRLMCNPMT